MNGAVLVVAAHPDDEVLGCGGTIARLAEEGRAVHVLLMADGETSRGASADASVLKRRNAAAEQSASILGVSSLEILGLPDNRLDSLEMLDLVRHVESTVHRHQAATVFTHHAGDVNIDHRIVHDAVIAATRPQPGCSVRDLLFFEVPSSSEWRPPSSATPFAPNWFVDIALTLERKLRALEAYAGELREFPHPRSLRAVEALACWRGATAGVVAAEAFILGRRIQ